MSTAGVTSVRIILLTLLLATGNALPAQTPAPLQAGERPSPGSTESELWYGMDQGERELRQSPYLVRDPALNEYVHGVACRVTGDYCPQLRVYIVDIPVFNASMAPNGAMLVFTGALLRMQDESELALVIGHEFGHFKLRHSLQFWEQAKRTTALVASFGPVVLVGDIVMLAGMASMFSFSREMEREADRLGFQRAVALGYDPTAGVRLWTRMLAEEKASHARKPLPVFAGHPKTVERLQDISTAAQAVPVAGAGTRTEAAAYRAAMHAFLADWLQAELSRRTYDTTIQVITDLAASATADQKGLYTFYLAEAYRRRNKNDDLVTASRLHARAIEQSGAPAEAWREYGMDQRAAGNWKLAATSLRQYLDTQPAADDRAFIEAYLAELEKHP